MSVRVLFVFLAVVPLAVAEEPPSFAEQARKIHETAILLDGHNDLPWRLRQDGDTSFTRLDLAKHLDSGHTDIPRARKGGLNAQFWSVYIPSEQPNPARTVTQQIDLVHRMIERYPNDLELALSAEDVERITRSGKIASLIGIEGGVAIENDLAQLRMFAKLGVRYMTLTHNTTLDWADAATDKHRHGGLTEFGERVVREMNRLGILVDISHVSADTMIDAIRVSKAPVIASHSSAFAICPHPRNVPDDVLKLVKANGGVIMVNFYSGFIVPGGARRSTTVLRDFRAKYPKKDEFDRAVKDYFAKNPLPKGTIKDVGDHIDHIRNVAGIDHVGLGSDFDGITVWPEGLDDVSTYPKITEELLRRGYSEQDVRKVLGLNALRALRRAGEVAAELRAVTKPELDPLGKMIDN